MLQLLVLDKSFMMIYYARRQHKHKIATI